VTAPCEQERAACQGLDVDPDWWESTDPEYVAQAIAVCGRCPEEQACLIWALKTRQRPERGGVVYGGHWFAGRRAS
jgi:Transcription factor WhiB